MYGNGKRTVFKVLKDSPENFRDLSTLADCDTDKSIDAASKLVCRLYDQKGKLKEVCCIEGKRWMHRIKKSVSGDLTMIRPLIPLSPNVLSAWIILVQDWQTNRF
jgi:hypothetical protein